MPTRHFVFLFEIFGYTTTLTEKDHHRVLVDNVEKIHVYSIVLVSCNLHEIRVSSKTVFKVEKFQF